MPYLVVLVDHVENGAEAVDVPFVDVVVREGPGDVGAVDRVHEGDVLPILPLEIFVVREVRRSVSGGRGNFRRQRKFPTTLSKTSCPQRSDADLAQGDKSALLLG